MQSADGRQSGPADGTILPHWTEPATGEVPVTLLSVGGPTGPDGDEGDQGPGPRWLDHRTDGDLPDSFADLGAASGLGSRPIGSEGGPSSSSSMVGDQGVPSADDEPTTSFRRISFDALDEVPDERATEQPGSGADVGTPVGGVPHGTEAAPPGAPHRSADRPVVAGADGSDHLSPGGDDGNGAKAPRNGGRFRSPSPTSVAKSRVSALATVSFGKRVVTAVAFAAIGGLAFAAGPMWVLLLSSAVVLLAAMELFDGLRRVGYRPATLLALTGVVGAMFGTYARGGEAVPFVVAMMVAFSFLWYLAGVVRESPTANIAATIFGFAWTGVLGSFAALLLRLPDHRGLAILGGAVMAVIAYDVGAYLGGSLVGRHLLIPHVSPNKTWEGLAVGTICAVLIGGLVVSMIEPWTVTDGLLLGLVVALAAPLGDLAESLIKRDLGLKDMGSLLPGHGGVMDRFDALLVVLPATYYLARVLNLA